MDAVRHAVVDQVEQAFENAVFFSPPPPSPPPPSDYGDYGGAAYDYAVLVTAPDILDFAGGALFFVCFFTSGLEVLESEELTAMLLFQDYEYAATPVHLTCGLGMGFVAYCLSYLQVEHFAIRQHGHLALVSVMFAFFSRHLCRVNQLSRKRSNILLSLGLLPLICLVMIKGEHVSVQSKKLLYMVVTCLAFIPVPQLFREWRAASYDAMTCKNKKRLFLLYFLLLFYVGVSTPAAYHRVSERVSAIGLGFDLALLYVAVDSLWLGR